MTDRRQRRRDERRHEPPAQEPGQRQDGERLGQRARRQERLHEGEPVLRRIEMRQGQRDPERTPARGRGHARGQLPRREQEQGMQRKQDHDLGRRQAQRVEHRREDRRKDAVPVLQVGQEEQVAVQPALREMALQLPEIEHRIVAHAAVGIAHEIQRDDPQRGQAVTKHRVTRHACKEARESTPRSLAGERGAALPAVIAHHLTSVSSW